MKELKNHPQKVGAKGLACVSEIEIDLRSVVCIVLYVLLCIISQL